MPNDAPTPKHRVFVDEVLEVRAEITAPESTTHYLSRVLRLREDAYITLFNGDGHNYLAQIGALEGKRLHLHILSKEQGAPAAAHSLVLALPLLKGERMDYALQKATELAADEVILFNAARSEVKLKSTRLANRMEHWRRVVRSASEQSGRTRLPVLHQPASFIEMLDATKSMDCYTFDPQATQQELTVAKATICTITGPEGGFEEDELQRLAKQSTLIKFGEFVLRAETAPVVALTIANLARSRLA